MDAEGSAHTETNGTYTVETEGKHIRGQFMWMRVRHRIRAHYSWEQVMTDPFIWFQVREFPQWAHEIFLNRFAHQDVDLDIPGFRWQGRVARFLFQTKPNNRTIHWLWGKQPTGKSYMARFLFVHRGACPILGEDPGIVGAMWRGQRVAVCHIFTGQRLNSYKILKELKDGRLTDEVNRRYWYNQSPHVIVFSPDPPELGYLSADRLHIICLDEVTDAYTLEDLFPPDICPEVAGVREDWPFDLTV